MGFGLRQPRVVPGGRGSDRRARHRRCGRSPRYALAAAAVVTLAALPLLLRTDPAPGGAADVVSPSESERALLLENLDVLEAIDEEAGELSVELVDLLLLEVLEEESETPLDSDVFEYILEEELASRL